MNNQRRGPREKSTWRAGGGRRQRRERGQALIEFALIVPIFLILILATVDFGWALRSWITVTNSAREAARLGAVGATCDDIKERAAGTSAGLLTTADVSVENCQGDPGTPVVVTVKYDYQFIKPSGALLAAFSGGALPSTITMTSSSDMRIE
jgi:Flp pilus assembly protein TadG